MLFSPGVNKLSAGASVNKSGSAEQSVCFDGCCDVWRYGDVIVEFEKLQSGVFEQHAGNGGC